MNVWPLLLAQNDGADAAAGALGGLMSMACACICPLIIVVPFVAGMWKIFEKAGQPGWAAIVPIYNLFVLTQIAGKDMDRRPFTYVFFTSGGTGARAIKDGLSATAFPSGVLGTPVEVIETLSPLVIEKKALRDGSGGDGQWRGGPAVFNDPEIKKPLHRNGLRGPGRI